MPRQVLDSNFRLRLDQKLAILARSPETANLLTQVKQAGIDGLEGILESKSDEFIEDFIALLELQQP